MSGEANKGRYLVTPLGLSYDNLVQAAIVATRRENSGNTVVDRETGNAIDPQELKAVVQSATKRPERVAPPQNLAFSFEGVQIPFPLLYTLITD